MKNNDIDRLLQEMGRTAVPDLPSNFQQDVWREIRHRKAIQAPDWGNTLDLWLSRLLQPAPISASLVLALLIGMFGAMTLQNKTTAVLDLYAFNPSSVSIHFPVKP